MCKLIAIDPGKCKCGLVLVDLIQKKVDQAIVLNSELLPKYVKSLNSYENISKVIVGNGTTSKQNIEKLEFIKKNLIVAEEKNSTYRAKNHEKGIIWNDKDLNLKLPIKKPLISKKDKLNITFKDFLKKYKHI